ncbi:MAG: RNA methyltransferase [Myxococcota bacterium]|nr:RNA methyltransferase [Myxococcota bacterium]
MTSPSPARSVSIALVHHPVLDGQGAIVTTAVTNLDVHDLARSARTYGCADYWVTHPIAAQRELVERIRAHWIDGSSGRRIPDRREALRVLRIGASLEDAITALGGREHVELWVTAARSLGRTLSFREARAQLRAAGKPVLVVFGTGWGLAPEVVESADGLLAPIRALNGEYNHLSVRAACAIALDRLLGAHE